MSIDLTTDIEVLLGRSMATAEAARADRLTELAIAKLEGALPGFTIEADNETVILDGEWTPHYPVAEVTSVHVNDLEVTNFDVDKFGHLRFTTLLPNVTQIANLPDHPCTRIVEIDYDFGFDTTSGTIPDDIAGVLASMVASTINRQTTNPNQAQSVSIGSYSEAHGDWSVRQAAEGLVVPDDALRHWRRNRAVSVALQPR